MPVRVGSVTLKNPLVLASAGYAATASNIKKHITKGFGAVVCKTVTAKALAGAPLPRIFWYDPEHKTMLSGAEALKNPGVDKMAEAIAASRGLADAERCLVVGSVSGGSVEEIGDNAAKLSEAGAHLIEIDMACPSTGPHLGPEYSQLGKYWAETSERAASVIAEVRRRVNSPVWIKAPLGRLLNEEYIKALDQTCPPDAYSYVGGRMPCLVIDTDTGEPLLPGNVRLMMEKKIPISPMVTGPVRPSTVFHTAYLANLTKVPLIPTGGLTTGDDIVQAIMAGASAAGICAAVYRDPDASLKILADLEAYAEAKGLASFESIRGKVLEHLPAPPLLKVQTVW